MRKLITAIYFFPNVGFLRSVASGCRSITSWITTFGIICVIFISSSFASQNKVSTSFETGELSVTDTIEDRDISGNFDYSKYRLKFNHDFSKITSYNLTYEFSERDYETSDTFDSTSNSWQAGFERAFENFKISPLKLDLDFGCKIKDYKNSPTLEYERSNATINLGYKYEDLWAIHWRNGFINYDYTKSGNDQLKVFTKLGGWKKFLDERLKLGSYYKIQNVDQKNESKDKIQKTLNCASSYKLQAPYFKEVGGFYEVGRTDTEDYEDEERDDDLKFKYTKWHITTEHPLVERLNTSLRYGQTRRKYTDSPNDYRNWLIENKTKLEIFEDKIKKINLWAEYQHRESDYHLTDSLNYIRNSAGVKLSYEVKNNWELAPGFAFKKYDYSANPTSSLSQYEAKADLTKEFPAKNLDLKLTYKYIWKEYKLQPEAQQWMLRAGIDFEF